MGIQEIPMADHGMELAIEENLYSEKSRGCSSIEGIIGRGKYRGGSSW